MTEKQKQPIIITDEEIIEIYGNNEEYIFLYNKDGEIKKIPSHNHFEAVLDPWHDDAFKDTPAEGMGSKGARKYHLYSIDWCGNLICNYGALPDGWQSLRKANLN